MAARNPRPSAVCGWPRSHLRSSTLVMQRLADRSDDIFMACAAAGYTAQCTRPGNDGGGSGVLNKQSARVLERSHSTGRGAREGIYLRCRRGLTCTTRLRRGAWYWYVLCKYGTQKSQTRARGASWESVGRSEVRAEGSGVMPQDCSNVSGTEDRARTPRFGEFYPKLHFLGVGGQFRDLVRTT